MAVLLAIGAWHSGWPSAWAAGHGRSRTSASGRGPHRGRTGGALFAGISRSGITIAAGLFVGLEREAAARFAFLMAVPIIGGAGLWKSRELLNGGLAAGNTLPLIAGMIASLLAGLVAVSVLLSYLRRHDTRIFIVYRLVLAALVVLYVLAR